MQNLDSHSMLLINEPELVLVGYKATLTIIPISTGGKQRVQGSQVMRKLSENVNHMPHKTSIEKIS